MLQATAKSMPRLSIGVRRAYTTEPMNDQPHDPKVGKGRLMRDFVEPLLLNVYAHVIGIFAAVAVVFGLLWLLTSPLTRFVSDLRTMRLQATATTEAFVRW